MALTVVVLSAEGARLTFDGTQRVVVGRGAGSDVRLPDVSVSVRHATLRAQGPDFVVVDEGSTNGTFVGSVRVAPQTSRIIRSGDRLRLGRIWLEVQIGQALVTRDLAVATRDIALAMVSRALDAAGANRHTRVQVVEGPDQGIQVDVPADGAGLVVGRAESCGLPLADPDVSRAHLTIERRAGSVWVRDLATKNGTWLGDVALPADGEMIWRAPQMVRAGHTVLALLEPVGLTLARIEGQPDEAMASPLEGATPPPGATRSAEEGAALITENRRPAPASARSTGRDTSRWSAVDVLVLSAALCVLALSLAGLLWLLRERIP